MEFPVLSNLIIKFQKITVMNSRFSNLLACALITATTSLSAQTPVLNVNGKAGNLEVYLQSLDIQIEVVGNIATTQFIMTFKNKTSKMLEGELLFPLPNGVTVSSYALDINGKMRDAVPVEKAKATQVFEEIEQRRVDPGILERVEGNNFRTRIYPFNPNGSRTISIGYEQELPVENGRLRYRLPMDYKNAIEKFSLKATVCQSREKPRIDDNANGEITFDAQGTNFVAEFSRSHFEPSNSLAFSLPVPSEIPTVVLQPASGSYYFTASCAIPKEMRVKKWSNEIAVIWDASLSGLDRDIKREMELLSFLIGGKKNLSISLYLLNNRFVKSGTFNIKNGDWSELKKTLESVVYDGGTHFESIKSNEINAAEIVFFSDGLSTLSHADFVKESTNRNKPVHCIVSSPKADYSALKWIAAQTGGKFVNMNELSQTSAKDEMMYETFYFLGVEKPGSVREVYPSVSTPVNGNFSIAGIMDAQKGDVTLLFGYGNKTEKRIKVTLDSKNAVQQGNIHRIWAQKKINELDMLYEQNKEELTELGQQFGIVTRNTSLMVLENLSDYITYKIEPPAELQVEYQRWKKRMETEQSSRENDLMANALRAADDLKAWWGKEFSIKKPKYPKPDNRANTHEMEAPAQMESISEDMEMHMDMQDNKALDEVVVVAFGAQRRESRVASDVREEAKSREQAQTARQATIKIEKIKQDKDYMKSLTENVEADYQAYLKLRAEYINSPTYYFDMADWFYRLDDKEKALRILTSIADMDIENASLFRLLGYRFKEYKEYELAVFACDQVIKWRPMEPQSYRDYALALADAGRYDEALKAMYSTVTQSYANNINARSFGLEEVVVTELNRMIAKNKPNTADINKKLIQAMPVDIRVVINWNMNSTDIDLHVKDPYGETCYYSNRATAIGGRISSDITQGYGPEQFMLKKAPQGKYEVFVNYFGDSQVKAEGPSTVMLEIFTYYSDNSEKREVVCLQMSKEMKAADNGLLKVAEFQF